MLAWHSYNFLDASFDTLSISLSRNQHRTQCFVTLACPAFLGQTTSLYKMRFSAALPPLSTLQVQTTIINKFLTESFVTPAADLIFVNMVAYC